MGRSDCLLVPGQSVSLQEDLVFPGQGRSVVTIEWGGLQVIAQGQATAGCADQDSGQHDGDHSSD